MAGESVLVVEDERDILELIKHRLVKEGFLVESAVTAEEGLEKAREKPPDLIVLDLMLPGIDGFDACRILKNDKRTQHIPIVMLTAKGEESDIVAGLETGADDYITKPFSLPVLVARLNAVLRRENGTRVNGGEAIHSHGVTIHTGRHEVLVNNDKVSLTPTEFMILNLLIRHPGWIYNRGQIIDATRDGEAIVTDRAVDVQIVNLRKKLGNAGRLIETVRGVGYKFKE
jgi:two-component system alkaline phosphatase synthesis response regulator PhoP